MFKDIAPKAKPGGIQRARKLRRKMTLPEVLLWRIFRQRPHGLKIRRQHETGDYTLDFFAAMRGSRSKSTARLTTIPTKSRMI